MTSDSSPVWFITGCSTGFGRELAWLVLDREWRAVVTARDTSRVQGLVSGHEERALALALDVTTPVRLQRRCRRRRSVSAPLTSW